MIYTTALLDPVCMETVAFSPQTPIWVGIFAAILTHLWFKIHEPASLFALLTPLLCACSFLSLLSQLSPGSGISGLVKTNLIYTTTILISITLYRLSPIHPLARFPGPKLWCVSKLVAASQAYREKGKVHARLKEWHEKYGPIVRVGPNELSIVNKEFIPIVLGASGLPKGPLWEGRLPSSPQVTLNLPLLNPFPTQTHTALRKSWDEAFSSVPLKNDYVPILVSNGSKLEGNFRRLCETGGGKAYVDFAKWMAFFSLDFMGDMAFGGRFHFMTEGDKDGLVGGLESDLAIGSFIQHVPWLGRILSFLSLTRDASKEFRHFALEQAKLRFDDANGAGSGIPERKDLVYHLLISAGPTEDPFSTISESSLTILAGSDTTSTVLRNIMYFLLAYPVYFENLRKEIDETFPYGKEIEVSTLSSMKLLNGIINEALRLLPALSTTIQRVTPVGYCGNNGESIPEGTGITITPYVIHRDARYFSPRPEEFWPERWFVTPKNFPSEAAAAAKGWLVEEENWVLDRAAYIPFSYGPGNCVGKSLALLELRYIIAILVWRFDFVFEAAFGEVVRRGNGDGVHGVRDEFTLSPGALPIIVSVRRE